MDSQKVKSVSPHLKAVCTELSRGEKNLEMEEAQVPNTLR